jgi:hypothetical protein
MYPFILNKSLSSKMRQAFYIVKIVENTYHLLSQVLRVVKRTMYGQVLDPTAFLCHHR